MVRTQSTAHQTLRTLLSCVTYSRICQKCKGGPYVDCTNIIILKVSIDVWMIGCLLLFNVEAAGAIWTKFHNVDKAQD